MTDSLGITLPENFDWADDSTWPDEFKTLFEYTGKIAYLALENLDKNMLDVQLVGSETPITMLFAIGDRANELRQAWRSVHALHNAEPPREPTS